MSRSFVFLALFAVLFACALAAEVSQHQRHQVEAEAEGLGDKYVFRF